MLYSGSVDLHSTVDALDPVFEDQPGWERFYLDMAGHSLSWQRPALLGALARDWLERLAQEKAVSQA